MFRFALFVFLTLSPFAGQANILYSGPFELNPPGETRQAAKVYLPDQYEKQAAWPLVVLLHGYTGTGDKEDLYLGVRYRVSTRGFVLVVPQGKTDSHGNGFWNATDFCCDFDHTGVDDVSYLTRVIQETQSKYKIDASRIYLYGHSNGGFMANRLACEMGSKIAGIASLAGGTFKNPADCRLKEPVPFLQIQAENDPTVAFGDDPRYGGGWSAVEQRLAANGCANRPSVGPMRDLVLLIPGQDTSSLIWNKCQSGSEVQFWIIKSYEAKHHSAHVPLFNAWFTDSVLDFLLKQRKTN